MLEGRLIMRAALRRVKSALVPPSCKVVHDLPMVYYNPAVPVSAVYGRAVTDRTYRV
jgi:hypothetical protein